MSPHEDNHAALCMTCTQSHTRPHHISKPTFLSVAVLWPGYWLKWTEKRKRLVWPGNWVEGRYVHPKRLILHNIQLQYCHPGGYSMSGHWAYYQFLNNSNYDSEFVPPTVTCHGNLKIFCSSQLEKKSGQIHMGRWIDDDEWRNSYK